MVKEEFQSYATRKCSHYWFWACRLDPNNNIFDDQFNMDEDGYVITDKLMQTSVEGVFAAGEIQDPFWKHVATSVGQGSAASISAEQWLSRRMPSDMEVPAVHEVVNIR